jgi:hypothetical protein
MNKTTTKSLIQVNSESKGQFHQLSMRSFCINSLAPVKYKPKMLAQKKLHAQLKYTKAAGRTLVKLTPAFLIESI